MCKVIQSLISPAKKRWTKLPCGQKYSRTPIVTRSAQTVIIAVTVTQQTPPPAAKTTKIATSHAQRNTANLCYARNIQMLLPHSFIELV